MNTAQISLVITVGFIILLVVIIRVILKKRSRLKKENPDLNRLKIIKRTFKDGHKEYQVEGKMYGYYGERHGDVLKYQYAILTCKTLKEAKEELRKAEKEIMSKELISKKKIYDKELVKKALDEIELRDKIKEIVK